jgi:menaquinone-dependent protoporphyrinogen oxidase
MNTLIFFTLLIGIGVPKAQDKTQYSHAVIVYMSKHGTTEKVAGMIKDSITKEPVTLINLKTTRNPDVSKCNIVIIGGSIHAGKIQKKVTRFCKKNEKLLLTKELGLYLCCMFKGEEAQQEFRKAYPEKLRNHAKAKALMGYELYFEKMNTVTRSIMKKLTGESQNVYNIDIESFNRFINELRKEYHLK